MIHKSNSFTRYNPIARAPRPPQQVPPGYYRPDPPLYTNELPKAPRPPQQVPPGYYRPDPPLFTNELPRVPNPEQTAGSSLDVWGY